MGGGGEPVRIGPPTGTPGPNRSEKNGGKKCLTDLGLTQRRREKAEGDVTRITLISANWSISTNAASMRLRHATAFVDML